MEFSRSIVWVRAMQLAQAVLGLVATLPRHQRFGMRDQMMRSAISIPSNIAEGWARESWREKAHFLAIAHGSLAELHTQLLLCLHIGWLTTESTRECLELADEVGRMLTVLRRKWRDPASRNPRPEEKSG